MKNIVDYVCTLEQAQKLRELGVSQESIYYFCIRESDADLRERYIAATEESHEVSSLDSLTSLEACIELRPKALLIRRRDTYSAFTSQELGELINIELKKYDYTIWQYNDYSETFHFAWWKYGERDCMQIIFSSNLESEVQARAEFLIDLLENKNDKQNQQA